jgi:hypothetical protein
MEHPTDGGEQRCGKTKRHTPHWHGKWNNIWCDGRHYEPTVQNIEKDGKQL